MFVLLKLLLYFFRPVLWIIAVFFYALLTKKASRKAKAGWTAFALLLLFTNPGINNFFIRVYETSPVQFPPSQTYTTGILLGGLVSYSPGDGVGYFNNASDRFIQTALLYKKGHIRNIIVAAGNGHITKNAFSEAGFIKKNLVVLGIPPERIFADSASRNTLENAIQAKRLIDSGGLRGPYLLISSAMHLPRAARVFQEAGIDATLYPADFLSRGTGNNWLDDYIIPTPMALLRWENLIKEWLGTLTYWLTGKA